MSAGAWAVPAVVVASAAPSYATSSAGPLHSLSIPPAEPGQTLQATVTISADALPVAPGSVTLSIEHVSGHGTGAVAPPSDWTGAIMGSAVVFTPPASPASLTVFAVSYVGAPLLRFTLVTPEGTYTQDVQTVAAA